MRHRCKGEAESNLCPRLVWKPHGLPRRDFFPLGLKFKRRETRRRRRDKRGYRNDPRPRAFSGAGAHAGQNNEPCKTDYWGHRMASSWTPERRARQAALIRTWKPWRQATGPRTLEGKATASRNAWGGGHRATLRELSRLVNAEIRAARDLIDQARA